MLIFVIMRRVAQLRYQARSQAWLNVDDTNDKGVHYPSAWRSKCPGNPTIVDFSLPSHATSTKYMWEMPSVIKPILLQCVMLLRFSRSGKRIRCYMYESSLGRAGIPICVNGRCWDAPVVW